jgi:hypothetical protein
MKYDTLMKYCVNFKKYFIIYAKLNR